jgi:uncharacterized protein (DUF736 family)
MKDVNVKVGELKLRERKDERTGEVTSELRGIFTTLQFSIAIAIDTLERDASAPKATDDTPTHRVTAQIGNGKAELGVAWERNIERGDYKGRPMFSIALNHPEMPDWASNLAAFPRGNSGEYHIFFQRRRQPQGAAPAGQGADMDDEIPF